MRIVKILLRLLLLKGPYWQRAYLISIYCIFIGYFIVFAVFFSLPPGPGWAMSSRLDRVLFMSAPYALVLGGVSVSLWVVASIIGVYKNVRGKADEKWGLLLGILPVLEYYVLSIVYNGFLSGRWRVVHELFYQLLK